MRIILFAFLIISSVACNDDNVSKLGTITGIVSNINGDTAISGARVVTDPSSDTVFTDSKGLFTLNDIEPGNYYVIATKEDFVEGNVPVIVMEGATVSVTFKLSRVPVVLTGQWQGRISHYSTDYPLSLNFDRVTADSIFGKMIIDFTAGADTFPIHSVLFFNNDSLHFDLSYTWDSCHAYDMWGSAVNKDSLQGKWKYRCTDDPVMTSPWRAHRKDK